MAGKTTTPNANTESKQPTPVIGIFDVKTTFSALVKANGRRLNKDGSTNRPLPNVLYTFVKESKDSFTDDNGRVIPYDVAICEGNNGDKLRIGFTKLSKVLACEGCEKDLDKCTFSINQAGINSIWTS